jgi:threonyl-tRNA synthetase
MVIVGKQEVDANSISVRRHGAGDLGSMSTIDLIARMQKEIETKSAA